MILQQHKGQKNGINYLILQFLGQKKTLNERKRLLKSYGESILNIFLIFV